MQTITQENRTHSKNTTKPFVAPTPIIQKKLTIGASNDAYEVEADRIADKVVNMSDTQVQTKAQTGALVQRKCADCEEEIQKKPIAESITPLIQKSSLSTSGEGVASNQITSQINSSKGGGNAMGNDTQNYMESRFGTDFSDVRIHTGSNAIQLSKNLNAQAFTVGNDIYFNEGEYNPTSTSGKHLLAHELTHTLQQGGTKRKEIQRRINCPASQNGSPADPTTALIAAKDKAANMALATSMLINLDLFSGSEFTYYLERFGIPLKVNNKYKNRFGGSTKFNDVDDAITSEINTLSSRYERISTFLSGTIHFVCSGNRRITVGNCTHRCGTNSMAASCSTGTHGRTIAICSEFWNLNSVEQRGAVIIHEVMHMLYRFGDRDNAPFANTTRKRGREPECYSRLTQDIYGVSTGDPSCPKINNPLIAYWRASGFIN